jgi:hypothetical protein
MSCLITMSQKELHRLELIQWIRGDSLASSRRPRCFVLAAVRSTGCCRPMIWPAPTVSYRRSAAVRANGVTARVFATWCST